MTHPNDPPVLRTYYWMITATWRGNPPQTASGTVDTYADDTYEDLSNRALLRYANKVHAPADMAVIMFHLALNDLP